MEKNKLKITVLGCGASGGVPLIGCTCPICRSDNRKNKRTRVSLLVQSGGQNLLIDTSPDMRAQLLRQDVSQIDAILYTHAHADHLHGIDDVRALNFVRGGPIDAYGEEEVIEDIRRRFGYVFLPPKAGHLEWYRPCLVPHLIRPFSPFTAAGIAIRPFEQMHGRGKTLGLRMGNFAYSTDTNGLSESAFEVLEGVDTWIVDCLRYLPAETHAHLEMALGWIARVKPRRAYLTHLNHQMDYDTLARELPENVFPAYDGLELEV